MRLRLLVASVLCFIALTVFTQTLPVPYFCGFEDPVENAAWVSITSTNNNWVVGTAEKSDGQYGMYVAYDNGQSVGCSVNQGYMSLYREVTLQAGVDYEIGFDWKNPGIGHSELYVCWLDETTNPVPAGNFSSTVYDLPSWFKNCVVKLQSDSVFTGSSLWHNVVLDVKGSGRPTKLLFFFRNKGTSFHDLSNMAFSAACIDNVQITEKIACLRPRNIEYMQIDASRGQFSWEGDLGPFVLEFRGVSDTTGWQRVNVGYDKFNVTTGRYECPVRPLRKGAYIAKVKQVCDCYPVDPDCPADTSMWTTQDIIIYYSDNHCLDFLDLNGSHVDCFVGNYQNPYGNGPVPPVDRGYTSKASRHTVHYDPFEYDEWTNYRLKTTPPDGLPSVRLGNYVTASDLGQSESMAEAITYHYTVDPNAPILLIKFAMLLEDSRHGAAEDPKFDLVITDADTGEDLQDVLCGRVDFVADFNDPTFQKGAQTTHDGNPVMLYKDWTTTGMNLQGLVGRNIDITFISRECAKTGHASYCYFTMDCMGAKISGVGCGDDMFGKIEAPDGFKYKWYPKSLIDGKTPTDSAQLLENYFNNPAFADTLKFFTPPGGISDDGIYVCRIFSLEDDECWFELEADLDPRDVFAEVKCNVKYEDCKATLTPTNTSYTKTRNRGDIGECDMFEWKLDGETVSMEKEYVFPSISPGQHQITMIASISGSSSDEGEVECVDTWDSTIVILPYGNTTDTLHVRKCTDNPNYTFLDGVTYNTTGIREHTIKGFAGCDSTVVLDMVVSSEVGIEINDTTDIDHLPYKFFDQNLETTGEYHATVPGQNGDCDTLYTLYLVVYPVLHIDFDVNSLGYACRGDESITYNYGIKSGTLETYTLTFDALSVAAGFVDQVEVAVADATAPGTIEVPIPETAIPNRYPATLLFDGDTTGTESFNFFVDLYYNANSTLQQKWNNVIAVFNADNNGGFDFSAFSWYQNGAVIAGATTPYLYMGDASLDFTAQYQARLTRVSDGVTLFTCPLTPVDRTANTVSEFPTLNRTAMAPRSEVVVSLPEATTSAVVTVYDVVGKNFGTYNLSSNDNTILAPDRTGIYLLHFTLCDGTTYTTKISVQ